jgi:hypothetical protein
MKKKLFKLIVIGASIGLASGQASAIDLSGLTNITNITGALSEFACPKVADPASDSGGLIPDASNTFCTIASIGQKVSEFSKKYDEFNTKLNSINTGDLLRSVAVLATNPKTREDLMTKLGKIGSAEGIKGVGDAATEAIGDLDKVLQGKAGEIKIKAVEDAQEKINAWTTKLPGGGFTFSIPGFTQAQSDKVGKQVSSNLGTAAEVQGTVESIVNNKTSKEYVANMTVVNAAKEQASTEMTKSFEQAANNVKAVAQIAKTRKTEVDQAVSTRAAIQVTTKLIADAMVMQSEQSATLIGALQKQAMVGAMTAQQLGTLVTQEIQKSQQAFADSNQKLAEAQEEGMTKVSLMVAQLEAAKKELPGYVEPVATPSPVVSSSVSSAKTSP